MLQLKLQSLLTLLALSSSALAQTFNVLAGAPSCAKSCSALQAAQSACNKEYPSGPFAKVATCFCTTPTVATFGSNPAGVCNNCDASDATPAGLWFGAYCAQPQTVTGVQAAAAATSAAVAATAVGAGATTAAAGAGATNTAGIVVPQLPQSWWSIHEKWIIMVIVLIIAFAIIIIVGVLWKKRYNRKRNAASTLPTGSVWGPNRQSHPNIAAAAMESNLTLGQRSNYGLDAEKGAQMSSVQRAGSDNSAPRPGNNKAESQSGQKSGGATKKLKRLVGK